MAKQAVDEVTRIGDTTDGLGSNQAGSAALLALTQTDYLVILAAADAPVPTQPDVTATLADWITAFGSITVDTTLGPSVEGGYTYFGGTISGGADDGKYLLTRYDSSGNETKATQDANVGSYATLALAWASRTSLVWA